MEKLETCIAFEYELFILYTYNILPRYANGKEQDVAFSGFGNLFVAQCCLKYI
jgi:hypothetical protein